jgi:RNase H-like domain found in reverse transcriptase
MREKSCMESSASVFMRKELDYLGHVISGEGISVDPSKIEEVKDWATPQDLKYLQSFLGQCNYYRRFVRNYSTIASPLSDLTKKAIPFKWGESQDKVFKELKDKLMTAPILMSADMSQPFEIQTDGSQTDTGAVLQQRDDNGVTRPVAYMSHKLNAAEQNYPTHDRELLAIVQALKLWRTYVLGHHLTVLTDNNPLRHLQPQSILSWRQARWVLAMQEFDFEFKYVQGKANVAADAISRKETKQIQPTWESLRMDKWKSTLPLLTISTDQYDTHMISKLMTEYLQDSEFATQFQSPKAPNAFRDGHVYHDGRFFSASRTVPYAASCYMITTARWLPVIDELPWQSRLFSTNIAGAHLQRTYATTSVRVTHVSAQNPIDGAVPVSSPNMRHPWRIDPKSLLISCLNYQKWMLVILD